MAAGTFGAGDFVFPGNLSINGDLINAQATGSSWAVRRSGTGLAVTDVTSFQGAVNTINDTDGGAHITLRPDDGTGAVANGRVEIVAYGRGSAAAANSIRFFTRSGAGAVAERMRVWSNGGVSVGVESPTASTLLNLASTTATLLIPRMTTTQKNALTAIDGMIVYDSTLAKFQGYEAGAWSNFSLL